MPYGHYTMVLPLIPVGAQSIRAQVSGWGRKPSLTHETQVAECVASHAQLAPEDAVSAAESTLEWLRSPQARQAYPGSVIRQQIRVWEDALPKLRVLAQECG